MNRKTKKRLVWTALLVSVMILTPVTSASMDKSVPNDEIGQNIREEIVGVKDNDFVVKRVITHYREDSGKNNAKGKGGGNAPAGCYKLMREKWGSLPVTYAINPANSGLEDAFVLTALRDSAETWDDATVSELFAEPQPTGAGYGRDYQNTFLFAPINDAGVIAQTTTWYTLMGRRILESDIVFNNNYPWGDALVSDTPVMDLKNIGVHEIGHVAALLDLYGGSCTEETMYGYSSFDETKKRDLNSGDIAGIQARYG